MPIRRFPIRPISPALILSVLALLFILPVFASSPEPGAAPTTSPNWGVMAMQLFGGLALFLFGMEQMASGLKSAAGSRMKDILARCTTNRVKAALTGGLVTAVIQSSSITTVLVVGFVSAGLMSLTQSVGVIMGANVGTTITAQIIAFKVEKAALAMIALGFAMLFISKKDKVKQAGNILMGLGLVFFGMGIMSEGMSPLRSYEPFIGFMAGMANPALGIAVGAVFTALVQSSSATTGIVIALGSQGLLPLPAGIALIFGANIGTCVTALLATLGKSREARRVALVHVIFNVLGVLLWVGFIPRLMQLVELVSPRAGDLEGSAQLAAEVPRQIANAHAIFNISSTLLLLPFATLIGRLARRLAPDLAVEPVIKPKFLDRNAFQVPSLALQNARLETARLGEKVCDNMQRLRNAFRDGTPETLDEIERKDDLADTLEGEILRYLGELRKTDLTDEESRSFRATMQATDSIESIGDIVSEEMVDLGRRRLASGIEASDTMVQMLGKLYDLVASCFANTIRAVRDEDAALAQKVIDQRHEIRQLENEAYQHQERRFQTAAADRLAVFRLEMAFVECLRRIYTHSKRVARTIANGLETNGPAAR